MSIIQKVFGKITGNRLSQKILERNALVSHYFMGIGSGSQVNFSGEGAIFRIMKKKISGPYCVLDVGANKGQFLKLALEEISADSLQIHCFEPGKETFKSLEKSFNGTKTVILNNWGLGKVRAKATLHYDSPGSGLASLTKRKMDHFEMDFEKSETVEIDTIDNYCKSKCLDRINLLKIDIEGHELEALAGAREMFEKKAIDLVTFEFGGCNIDTKTFFQDFWYFFDEVDFSLFRITPSGYLYRIKNYREIDEQFRTTNFLAIRSN